LKIVATYDFNGGKAAVQQKYAAEFVHQCLFEANYVEAEQAA